MVFTPAKQESLNRNRSLPKQQSADFFGKSAKDRNEVAEH